MSKETELSKKYRETFQIPTFYFIARTALIFSKEPFSLLCRGLTGPSCPRNGTLYLAILFPVHLRDRWHSKSVCVFMNEGWRWGLAPIITLRGKVWIQTALIPLEIVKYSLPLQSHYLTIPPQLQSLMEYSVSFRLVSRQDRTFALLNLPFPQALLN